MADEINDEIKEAKGEVADAAVHLEEATEAAAEKAEEILSNNELRFRTLTVNAPVGIFQTDANGKTIYVNETWLQYTGLRFNEAIGDFEFVEDASGFLKARQTRLISNIAEDESGLLWFWVEAGHLIAAQHRGFAVRAPSSECPRTPCSPGARRSRRSRPCRA